MRYSETNMEVLNALFMIQEDMVVDADAENTHFHSKYATLDNILRTVRPVLKESKLMILQHVTTEERKMICTTRLIHITSGEWMESDVAVTADAVSSQAIGSALTYLRRYGVCMILGIGANADDDGEGATKAMDAAQKKEEKRLAKLDEKNELDRFKASILPRLLKYDAEAIALAFEESGYFSEITDKESNTADLIKQVNSKDKLTLIGKRIAVLQKEVDDSVDA